MTPVPDQKMSVSWQQRIDSLLELAPKLAALSGVAYICGLVVVQTHLQRYGVNRLGFFAPQYIAAGLWGLVFVAGLGVGAFLVYRKIKTRWPLTGKFRPWKNFIHRSGELFSVALVAAAVLGVLGLLLGFTSKMPWPVLGGALFLLWSGQSAILYSRLAADPIWGHPPQANPWLAILPDTLLLFTFGLVLFGKYLYPTIPARWGGGQPVPVQMVVTAEGAARLFKATIIRDTSLAVRGRLLLLTDDDVLILPNGHERPVLLRRDLVPAIVLQPVDTADIDQSSSRLVDSTPAR